MSETELTLHKAAMRLCDLAVRIERAPEDSKEQHDLCDKRDALLSLFRKADDARPLPSRLDEEIEALRHDLDRYIKIAADLATESAATRRLGLEEAAKVRQALLIAKGFVVAALKKDFEVEGLDTADHLVVREIDAAIRALIDKDAA